MAARVLVLVAGAMRGWRKEERGWMEMMLTGDYVRLVERNLSDEMVQSFGLIAPSGTLRLSQCAQTSCLHGSRAQQSKRSSSFLTSLTLSGTAAAAASDADISSEIRRRRSGCDNPTQPDYGFRTFAIISHPDAGKTTLTEKLLLYGGAVQEAGAVKAKGERRRATSDWMKIEQERGISISSTALQFEYRGMQMNLLDTPGHEDFSEDTYRTIAAADNAVMLLDGAKGLEAQTLKLFDVVKLRKLPLFTFINKMDRPSLEPLELLDTIEKTLGVVPCPMTWPIGSGDRFQGVYDRVKKKIYLFERVSGGGKKASEVQIDDLNDSKLVGLIPEELLNNLREELEILDEIAEPLDIDKVLEQKQVCVPPPSLPLPLDNHPQTPVWFGSGYNNFGIQNFLDSFLEISQGPRCACSDQLTALKLTRRGRTSTDGVIPPDSTEFSGFVFKLQ
eukprot:631106-Hanusia_phi.AAC.1